MRLGLARGKRPLGTEIDEPVSTYIQSKIPMPTNISVGMGIWCTPHLFFFVAFKSSAIVSPATDRSSTIGSRARFVPNPFNLPKRLKV